MALATSFEQTGYVAPYATFPTASYTFTFNNEGTLSDVVFIGGATLDTLFGQVFDNATGLLASSTVSVASTTGPTPALSGAWLGTHGSPIPGMVFALALQDCGDGSPGFLLALAGAISSSMVNGYLQYADFTMGPTGPLAVGFTYLGAVVVTGGKVFLMAPQVGDPNFETAGMTLTTSGVLDGANLAGVDVAAACATWAGSLFLQGTKAAAQVVARQYLTLTGTTAAWQAADDGAAGTTLAVGVPVGAVVPLTDTTAFLRPVEPTDVLRWVSMPAGSAWTVNTVGAITAADVPLAAYVVSLTAVPVVALWWTTPSSLRAIAGTPSAPNVFPNSASTDVTPLGFTPTLYTLVTVAAEADTAVFLLADDLGNLAAVQATVTTSLGGGGLVVGVTVLPQTAVSMPVGYVGTAVTTYANPFDTPPKTWYSYTATDELSSTTTVFVGPLA